MCKIVVLVGFGTLLVDVIIREPLSSMIWELFLVSESQPLHNQCLYSGWVIYGETSVHIVLVKLKSRASVRNL